MNMKVSVITLDNKKSGDIELNPDVFGIPVRADLLHAAVRWQLAKRQQGTHKTKGESEVSGTGKKPYKQKGTGNARHGSLRSPQYRGGAIIFGPVVRSHSFDLPKKVRKLALKTALSAKLQEGKLQIVKEAKMAELKTAHLAKKLGALGLNSVLIIDGQQVDANLASAAANLKAVDVLPQIGANVYDILRHDNLILTEEAVKQLEERLK